MPPPADRPRPEYAATQSFVDPHAAARSGASAAGLEGLRLGQYRVLAPIGRGGMGVVYEARHEGIGQRAAVKTLSADLSRSPDFVQRFFTEARAAAMAQHPGLVKIFDHGQLPSGELYILMEYLEGEPLSRRLTREGSLPPATSVRVARQIAAAMALVHEKGILHRDLKPDNLFVVPDSEVESGERVKILDFGLAKITQSVLGPTSDAKNTAGTLIMGTAAYMAPEQCRGLAMADGKADVYALGAILYEMLTGSPPFTGSTPADIMALHITQQPPPLQDKCPGLSPALVSLAHRMLAKSAEARPSMQQVAIELTRIAAGPLWAADKAAMLPLRFFRPPVLWLAAMLGTGLLAAIVVPLLGRVAGPLVHARTRPDMVRMPGGEFLMGSTPEEIAAAQLFCQQLGDEGCDKERFRREHPVRSVWLSAFLLDGTEVDNQHFAAWLSQNQALRVDEVRSYVYAGDAIIADLYTTYGNGGIFYRSGKFGVLKGYEHRPVTQVTWDGAVSYCQAQGKRLPTEAEWEYAARGGQGFRFPWGDDEPRCDGTVFARQKGQACWHLPPGPQDVGSSPQDRSPQQICDLAGNVSEWVQDSFTTYGSYAACEPPCKDPVEQGAAAAGTAELRVVRGGDWFSPAWVSRAAGRSRVAQSYVSSNLGFRCAKSAER